MVGAAAMACLVLLLCAFTTFRHVNSAEMSQEAAPNCNCRMEYVESIPTGMTFPQGPVHRRTHEAWLEMLSAAKKTVRIAALYWNLNSTDYTTAQFGREVFAELVSAGRRGVDVRITQDVSKGLSDNSDSKWLADHGLAQVRTLNFEKIIGSGVLHTKFIIVDGVDVYVGSANMDWKSLAEVKELGVYIRNCPCLAADLSRIFAVYWHLGQDDAVIPSKWPAAFETGFNMTSPMKLTLNNLKTDVFISSSPAEFNPSGREHDLSTIISLIRKAKRTVCVSVMDLIPQILYMGVNNSYWPDIDDALRAAAFRGVSVRLLVSQWDHSRREILPFLRSLLAINDALPKRKDHRSGQIKVKLFTVPATEEQRKIPFARVNHNKYMVTDQAAYVGTSNWAGDYFITTAGVGVVFASENGKGAVRQLQGVFWRDWNSPYAAYLKPYSSPKQRRDL